VEDDGTARELEADEIEYLGEEFRGSDGARPYIKSSYAQRTPDGHLRGYLLRTRLPAGVRVKSTAQAIPVETAAEAIRIVKLGLPVFVVVRDGAGLARVAGELGESQWGAPGVAVASGSFSATLAAGVWRVVRLPRASARDTEQACFADVSAASGRIIRYGRSEGLDEPMADPLRDPIPGSGHREAGATVRRPWWRVWR
jgi:hypothetical protein